MTAGGAAAAAEFTGFRPAALAFLRGLRRHNDRDWFARHRDRYEVEVRGPLAALVEEMDVRLARIAPEIVGDPKRSLFRLHRDVRFSADKSPFRTHATCWFHHGGATTVHGGAGFYVDVGPDASRVGGGIWMPPRPTLLRIRERVDEEHESLAALLRSPALRRYGGLAREAMLARMPRGYDAAHPAGELLRHRSFTMGRELRERDLFDARLPDLIARDVARLLPLVRWLNGAIGLRALARR